NPFNGRSNLLPHDMLRIESHRMNVTVCVSIFGWFVLHHQGMLCLWQLLFLSLIYSLAECQSLLPAKRSALTFFLSLSFSFSLCLLYQRVHLATLALGFNQSKDGKCQKQSEKAGSAS